MSYALDDSFIPIDSIKDRKRKPIELPNADFIGIDRIQVWSLSNGFGSIVDLFQKANVACGLSA
jgi:hypothetical protein